MNKIDRNKTDDEMEVNKNDINDTNKNDIFDDTCNRTKLVGPSV